MSMRSDEIQAYTLFLYEQFYKNRSLDFGDKLRTFKNIRSHGIYFEINNPRYSYAIECKISSNNRNSYDTNIKWSYTIKFYGHKMVKYIEKSVLLRIEASNYAIYEINPNKTSWG